MKALRSKTSSGLMFRAFSDPTRLRILHLLRAGETCVGDVVSVVRIPQSTASRHLAYLRRAGLTIGREDKKWVYYRLAESGSPFHRKLLECLGECFTDVPEFKADGRRLAAIRKRGGCCPP